MKQVLVNREDSCPALNDSRKNKEKFWGKGRNTSSRKNFLFLLSAGRDPYNYNSSRKARNLSSLFLPPWLSGRYRSVSKKRTRPLMSMMSLAGKVGMLSLFQR